MGNVSPAVKGWSMATGASRSSGWKNSRHSTWVLRPRLCRDGKLADITPLAQKEGWAKVIPTALQKFTTSDGKWGAVPVNIHSVNWIWVNKAVMDKIGGTEPKNFGEFIALLDKAKAAGVIPLALGGQPWQEATMFDSIVASTGGTDFYKKAFIDLDESALKSDTMKKSFDNLGTICCGPQPSACIGHG
jgi:glucose/mannose transport system substrate-binding protein